MLDSTAHVKRPTVNRTASSQPKQTVLYARVSSDEQEKEGFSIPAQTKLLREYADNERFDVAKEYVDVETAKSTGRSGFDGMVKFLTKEAKSKPRESRCRVILVEKTDRLYRNMKDYVTLDELDVEIHFVKENFVLSPDSHSSQKFLHGIKVLMAKNYVDNLSEETRKGLLEKAEQGIWPLKAPIGFQNALGTNGKKVIEPDLGVAPLIVKVYEDYATGKHSLEEVTLLARQNGLVSPRSRKPAHRAWIHKILTNRIYYGDFVWKGKVYHGVHQVLVSRELWDKVQAVLRSRGIKKPKRRKHEFAFSGLLTCQFCGCSVVSEIKKGRYIYYHCTGSKGDCSTPYTREEVLEERFTGILRSLRFDDAVVEWLRTALRESYQDEQQCHDEAVQRLQTDYNLLQRRIQTMYLDKLDGRVDAEFFDAKSAEWREDQARIRSDIERHEAADQSYMEEGITLLELANSAADLFEKQPSSEKRKLLDFVLSNSLWDGETLVPVFRQPFDMIADAAATMATEKAVGSTSDDLCQARGGQGDSNPRPLEPQSSALTN